MRRMDFLCANIVEGRILDIGNLEGQGKIHKQLISFYPNSEFYGLDIVDQKSIGVNFEHQKTGAVENMPYENDFFDTVYMGQILEHSWEPKKITDECYRVLKPKGVLVIDVPNTYALSRMIRYFFTGKDIIIGNPEHKLFFSRATLEILLSQSRFTITNIISESVIAIKGLRPLPSIGPFKYMGEVLCVSAKKSVEV